MSKGGGGSKNMISELTKKKSIALSSLVVGSMLCVLAGVGISGAIEQYYSAGRILPVASSAPPAVSQGLPDFASLAKRVGPSVVNVSTTQVRKAAADAPSPFEDDDPMSQFWQRFFGGRVPRGPQRQNGLGSGFIIDRNGTILTNYHVVDGAQKIAVTLSDGKTYDAKVIGKDQKTDIAVIKIDAGQDLPVATLGDSDNLEVGEWVMAIGNPFGLDHTVTSGIVSAKGRHIGAGPYDDFIQTDASVNPGNSGGPLVNGRGEVVGINVAIVSQTGANVGIAFAMPINLVKELLPQLQTKGTVTRGWAGLAIQEVTPDIAQAFGLAKPGGALVAGIVKGGPAERGGIKVGDIVTEYDGRQVKDANEFPLMVARTPVNKDVRMKVFREKKEIAMTMTIGELKDTQNGGAGKG